jgi:hypothetical protein
VPFAGLEGLFFHLRQYAGLNTRTVRTDINDEQFSWLENFIPIDAGNMRALYSNGTPIYTTPGGKTIVYFRMFNIGAVQYSAVFLNDGTAVQVAVPSGTQVTINATANLFYDGGQLPNVAQWGSSGIIIAAPSTAGNGGNGYFAWDEAAGGTLYGQAGGATAASPTWLNNGVPTTMPTGIKGTYAETYQSRAWIADAAVEHFSAPGNGASFSGATGGGSFTSSDSFLRNTFVANKQNSGFLYLFGDSSINVVDNVQTGGTPLATTFTNRNVDPQIGTPWPGSVQVYSSGEIIFANPIGVFSLSGGFVKKISDELDGLFLQAVANPTPTAAIHIIFEIRCYCLTLKVVDIFGTPRVVMCCWDGRKWFLASQQLNLVYLDTQEINTVITAWGSNGTQLFQLFQTPSALLNKILQTRQWQGSSYLIIKQALRIYSLGTDFSGKGFSLSGTLDLLTEQGAETTPVVLSAAAQPIIWLNNAAAVVVWVNNSSQVVTFVAQALNLFGEDVHGSAPLLGLTLQSMSSDFQLSAISLLYRHQGPVGG